MYLLVSVESTCWFKSVKIIGAAIIAIISNINNMSSMDTLNLFRLINIINCFTIKIFKIYFLLELSSGSLFVTSTSREVFCVEFDTDWTWYWAKSVFPAGWTFGSRLG